SCGISTKIGIECSGIICGSVKSVCAWNFTPLRHRKLVTTTEAIKLLENFRAGGVSRDKVLRAFQAAPVADLGFAQVDTHRALRKGFPEVVFGAGKTPEQVLKIAAKLLEREQRILVTRITSAHAQLLRRKFKAAVH